jgi:outer membrane receptor protein involved in Fe transport
MEMAGGSWQVYGNVENLFDRSPSIVASYSGFNAAPLQTNVSLFDQLGRRFTVGARINF